MFGTGFLEDFCSAWRSQVKKGQDAFKQSLVVSDRDRNCWELSEKSLLLHSDKELVCPEEMDQSGGENLKAANIPPVMWLLIHGFSQVYNAN